MQIRHFLALLVQCLRKHRACHSLAAVPQVNQNKCAINFRAIELWRERVAHIGYGRECADHQRDGGDDFVIASIVLPLRAHRERIFAHGDADA